MIDEQGASSIQEWSYPSRVQCMSCHNANAAYVLGVNTYQLNGNLLYPSSGVVANQLETWNHLGIFSTQLSDAEIQDMSRAVSLENPEASLQDKVVSYLAANCAYCHRPDGVEGAFDARFDTPLAYKNLINAGGKSHNNPSGGVIVKPGFHEKSQLWIRDNSVDKDKMPPLAKSIVDEKWISVLTEWIDGLDETCVGVYLSDLDWDGDAINGFGPIELDQSNGEFYEEDGGILSINGREFERGIGVHAYSEITYFLNQEFVQFSSFIGVDDESCDRASLQFLITLDDEIVFRSEMMGVEDDPRFVSIDLEGGSIMKLIVTSPQDGIECDHANWADAKLLKSRDSDGDGVCDNNDICEGADDNVDENFDGIPDGCEELANGGEIEIKIGPNPFSNQFTLMLQTPEYLISRAQLTIADLNGRVLYRDDNVLFETNYTIGESLPSGTFIIQVKAGSFRTVKKVIKLP
ncbi:NPCBM/NEW2 domain-containing protein [Saprospiraceae bacterium]|nr:NPCBM/NEW2 domain-containing protein [Saprospiraceae bacterium]